MNLPEATVVKIETSAPSWRCVRARRRRLGTEAPPDPASEMDDTLIRRGCADRLRGLDRRVADLADGPLVLTNLKDCS